MQSGVYTALSAQMALRERLDTVAHNIANSSTAGFRAELVRFESLIARNAGGGAVAFASSGDSYLSLRSGPMTKTGNPLDVAVSGQGFLGIRAPQGIVYTRDGRMTMSAAGLLQSVEGLPYLDAGGAPIQLDPNGGAPAIARDGMITQNGQQVGALGLFAVDAAMRPKRAGHSGVSIEGEAPPILDFTRNSLMQGHTEGSNVNPVEEMARLMLIQRNFEKVAAIIESTEATTTDAIRTLGGA